METISGCRLLKASLKAKFIYMLILLPKIFLMEDFFHLPPSTPVVHLEPRISKKFEMAVVVHILRCLGETEKRRKSRGTVPLSACSGWLTILVKNLKCETLYFCRTMCTFPGRQIFF
jgi:hypothetical protein